MTGDRKKSWRGSFAIPMIPFDEKDRIDEDVLRAEIEYCVECGVGGIPVPMMVSEYDVLSEAERRLVVEKTVEAADRRAPVVANCTAPNRATAMEYARFASNQGADAVIAMVKPGRMADYESIREYYAGIAEAAGGLPVFIQSHDFAPLSVDQLVRLCTEIENVNWIKEEATPAERRITELLARNCPEIHGVMGGYGGIRLITEWERGSSGLIHACDFCDVVQHIWELLDAGEQAEAEELFDRFLPTLVLLQMGGLEFSKRFMVKRGVFRSDRVRWRKKQFDAHDLREFDRVYERIQPYLRWPRIKKGGRPPAAQSQGSGAP